MLMASKLIQPSISAAEALCLTIPRSKITKKFQSVIGFRDLKSKSRRYDEYPFGFRSIFTRKSAEQSSGLSITANCVEEEEEEEEEEEKTVAQIKEELYEAVKGINRGIYGVPSAKRSEIEELVRILETQNPNPNPTESLDKAGGSWKLIYSTITILGAKRTKLGLREFIELGDFLQNIDVSKGKAVNIIKFKARGLNLLNGQLKIEASFKIASKSRLDITYESSKITPDQLMNIFRKNYDLLLGIFNPEGWLEISYVDDTLQIGRDDKGNVFVLEKTGET